MIKKHIITIAGKPGSGKSSTATLVAAELGFEHYSSGGMFRAAVKEQGKELLQANQSAEGEGNDGPDLDAIVDGKIRELGDTKDRFVIDSRTAWHWIPESFKVLLDLDVSIGAQRAWDDTDEARRAVESMGSSPEDYATLLQARLDSENRRYHDLYNIDPYNVNNYDLVVNTALHDKEQVGAMVLKAFYEWVG